MAADNWMICPRCAKNQQLALRRAQEALEAAEAANDLAAYKAAVAAQEKARLPLKQTYSEYYTIGPTAVESTQPNVFIVSYEGSCDVCGFRHRLRIQEPLKL